MSVLSEEVAKMVEKCEQISRDANGGYTHFDVTIQNGGETKFNIYTPLISHRSEKSAGQFHELLDDLIKNGQESVRMAYLQDALKKAESDIERITDNIGDLKKEIEFQEKGGAA